MDNDFIKNLDKIDKTTLEAAKRGDTNAVFYGLNEKDRKKVKDMLSDEEKLKKLLNSDAAQKLLKILGGNNNG